jgi:predicted nuclease of restriction endonuclease-like (RecB) superfamily
MERWSVRTFRERIDSMLYERTAISKMPDETIKNELASLKNTQQITPDLVFRDPYFLDFLGLHNSYSENDLESAILAELQNFIIELGSDFAFLARQKRITIDQDDYYIDLLFYHRKLKRLIAIDLKLGKFKASDKGQIELYLAWLAKHESMEGENKPLGLILCASKNEEHAELMQLEKSNIKIAEYLTQLPDMKLLEAKLQMSIERAKNRLAQNDEK